MRDLHETRVLIIEDDAPARDAVAALFALEGAVTSAVGTGQQALELFRAEPFDVVVADLGLPDIPGDVLIRTLRAAASGAVRVIGITGGGEAAIARARDAGAESVLAKPLNWAALVEELSRRDVSRAA